MKITDRFQHNWPYWTESAVIELNVGKEDFKALEQMLDSLYLGDCRTRGRDFRHFSPKNSRIISFIKKVGEGCNLPLYFLQENGLRKVTTDKGVRYRGVLKGHCTPVRVSLTQKNYEGKPLFPLVVIRYEGPTGTTRLGEEGESDILLRTLKPMLN